MNCTLRLISNNIKYDTHVITHYEDMWSYPSKIKYGFILKDQIHAMKQLLKHAKIHKVHYLRSKHPLRSLAR